MTIEELTKIMQEEGIILRAIPIGDRVSLFSKNSYNTELKSNQTLIYDEESKREVIKEVNPPHPLAGKFLIQRAGTGSVIHFNKKDGVFNSIEDALNSLKK